MRRNFLSLAILAVILIKPKSSEAFFFAKDPCDLPTWDSEALAKDTGVSIAKAAIQGVVLGGVVATAALLLFPTVVTGGVALTIMAGVAITQKIAPALLKNNKINIDFLERSLDGF